MKVVVTYKSGNTTQHPTNSSQSEWIKKTFLNCLNVSSVELVEISKKEYWSLIEKKNQ